MSDYPDGAQLVQIAVTVDGLPQPQTPGTEYPAGANDHVTTTSTSYQTVASWTVTSTRTGKLVDISMLSTNYSKTKWQLTIGGVVQFTGLVIDGALTKTYNDLSLAGGAVVLLEAASSDGSSITADGSITGKEVG